MILFFENIIMTKINEEEFKVFFKVSEFTGLICNKKWSKDRIKIYIEIV